MGVDRSTATTQKFFNQVGIIGRVLLPFILLAGAVMVFLTTELRNFGPQTVNEWKRERPKTPDGTRPILRPAHRKLNTIVKVILGLIPLGFLVGAAFLFLKTDGLLMLFPADAAKEALTFEKTDLQLGRFVLNIRNPSSRAITITTVNVNDSIIPFVIQPGKTIPPLASATVSLLYPWVEGEAYTITAFTSDSASFSTVISSAASSTPPTVDYLVHLLLIGLVVGLLPVLAGITWFPALTRAGTGLYIFLIALAAGVLVYLGVMVANKALENTLSVNGAFQGVGLVAVGIAVTFMLLIALARIQPRAGERETAARLAQSWSMAVWIGLQNFAEGLAVGAAFSFGAAALGVLFILGLVIQNMTEGLRMVASMEKGQRSFWQLLAMGLVGGIPVVLGIWIGGTTTSRLFLVLLFSIGAGAVFEAVYEVYKQIQRTTFHQPRLFIVFTGFTVGLLALYGTGLLIF